MDDTSPVSAIAAPPTSESTGRIRSRLVPGAIDLSLSPPQQELLRDCLVSGFVRSREALADTAASATEIVLDGVTSSILYDFDPDAPGRGPSGELIAGVLQRFEGPLSGTALFALDPGDALLWLQRGEDDGPPLDRFVDWGSRVLGGAVEALADATRSPVERSRPVLEERPLMAALLGTHAPSDTVVLSIHGSLAFPVANLPELRAPFSIQVLLEPKRIAGILAALSGGDGDRHD